MFEELVSDPLEPIALLSASEIIGYLVSAPLWDAQQASDQEPQTDTALAAALLNIARAAAERIAAQPTSSADALVEVSPAPQRRPGRQPGSRYGGPKTTPEIWDKRHCQNCDGLMYTTWVEDRTMCRKCEKKVRSATQTATAAVAATD